MTCYISRFSPDHLLRGPDTGCFLGLTTVFLVLTAFGGAKFASFAGAANWRSVPFLLVF